MAFVRMEIGDADDDEIVGSDAESFPEHWVRLDIVEKIGVYTIRDNGDFFSRNTDLGYIEVFDRFGIREVAGDKTLCHFFQKTRDKIFRVVVGGAEEGDDRH